MKQVLPIIAATAFLLLTHCDLASILDTSSQPAPTGLSETEIITGLKEALVLGSKTAAFTLSDTTGKVNYLGEATGYLTNELVKIALPDDVEMAYTNISKLSDNAAGKLLLAAAGVDLSQYRDAMIKGLNRGAEHAAGLSVEVFTDAITGMTFSSARDILFGEDSLGATAYLEVTTTPTLTDGFKPIIDNSFASVELNALGSVYTVKGVWSEFTSKYNLVADAYQQLKTTAVTGNLLSAPAAQLSLTSLQSAGILSVDPLNTDIVDYATGKALNGLFLMVGRQEVKLRADPWAALSAAGSFITETVKDLLEKVFTSGK